MTSTTVSPEVSFGTSTPSREINPLAGAVVDAVVERLDAHQRPGVRQVLVGGLCLASALTAVVVGDRELTKAIYRSDGAEVGFVPIGEAGQTNDKRPAMLGIAGFNCSSIADIVPPTFLESVFSEHAISDLKFDPREHSVAWIGRQFTEYFNRNPRRPFTGLLFSMGGLWGVTGMGHAVEDGADLPPAKNVILHSCPYSEESIEEERRKAVTQIAGHDRRFGWYDGGVTLKAWYQVRDSLNTRRIVDPETLEIFENVSFLRAIGDGLRRTGRSARPNLCMKSATTFFDIHSEERVGRDLELLASKKVIGKNTRVFYVRTADPRHDTTVLVDLGEEEWRQALIPIVGKDNFITVRGGERHVEPRILGKVAEAMATAA